MQEGLSEAQVIDLEHYVTSPHFSAREKLALTYAERITCSDQDVDEALFARRGKPGAHPAALQPPSPLTRHALAGPDTACGGRASAPAIPWAPHPEWGARRESRCAPGSKGCTHEGAMAQERLNVLYAQRCG